MNKLYLTLIALLLLLISFFYYLFSKVDMSIAEIDNSFTEVSSKEYSKRAPIVLVSYADGPNVFFKNQNALAQSAINKGIDHVFMYKRNHIDPEFYNNHSAILKAPIGAGYWLWKPYFIYQTMNMMPDNSIILYADSGVLFTQSVSKLLRDFSDKGIILVGHGKPAQMRGYIKREARQIFGIDNNEDILNSQNIWAFFMAIRNNQSSREFIKTWLDMCSIQDAITNTPFDKSIQEKPDVLHQHDQSILSIVAAKYPKDITIVKRHHLRKKYGVHNYHRHTNRESNSSIGLLADVPRWISDLIFNNPIIRWFRRA